MKRLLSTLVIAASTALCVAPRVARAATYDVVATIPAHDAHYVAIDHGLSRVYIQTTSQMFVIDETTDTVIATLPEDGDGGIVADSTTHEVFVAHQGEGTLNVYDGLNLQFIGTLDVGVGADRLAVDESTHTVYCVNGGGDTVRVIDGVANVVTDIIGTGLGLHLGDVTVDPTTHQVYLLAGSEEALVIVDGLTNTVVDVTFAGPDAESVLVDPALHTIYILNGVGLSVAALDQTTHALIAVVTFGGDFAPNFSIDPVAHTIWVMADHHFVVIDGTTNTIAATVADEQQYDVAIDPITHAAYVTHTSTGVVKKIVPACTGVICAFIGVVHLGGAVARVHVGHGLGLTLVIAGIAETAGNQPVACRAMDAFISEVASGSGSFLTGEQASEWTEEAVVIEDAMGC